MIITVDQISKYLTKEINNYYDYILKANNIENCFLRRGIGSVLHEYIIGLLFILGKDSGYFPLPEIQPNPKSNHRIDLAWFDVNYKIVAAFEIDRSIYPKSINKLNLLPEHCNKFIISIGLGRAEMKHNLLFNTKIEHINLTQTMLGVYFNLLTTN